MGTLLVTGILLIIACVQAPPEVPEWKVTLIFAAGWVAGAILNGALGV